MARVTAAVAIAAAAAGVAAQAPLNLTILPQDFADQYGAKCLDGSSPGFYASYADPKRWVLFIEGGGWCSDVTAAGTITNCAGRAAGGGGSSTGYGPQTIIGGLLSTDPGVNPRFHNYSLVFLKYCDGTSHSSYRPDPVPVPSDVMAAVAAANNGTAPPAQIWFRGRANLVARLQWLLQRAGMAGAEEVVLSGGSAGATSTFLAADFVRSLLPPTTRYTAAPDAGFFLDYTRASDNTTWYRDTFIAADAVWNSTAAGSLNPACVAAFAPVNQTWRCYLPQYSLPFISSPLYISGSSVDMWALLNDLALGCVPSTNGLPVAGNPSCNAAQLAAIQRWWTVYNTAALGPLLARNPALGAFICSCFVHEVNVDYCSTQALPNCVGWARYSVTPPTGGGAPPIVLRDAFTAFYDDAMTHYEELNAAAADAARRAQAEAAGALAAGVAPEGLWAHVATQIQFQPQQQRPGAQFAPHQVVDQLRYPNNPSCPFPTASPAPVAALARA